MRAFGDVLLRAGYFHLDEAGDDALARLFAEHLFQVRGGVAEAVRHLPQGQLAAYVFGEQRLYAPHRFAVLSVGRGGVFTLHQRDEQVFQRVFQRLQRPRGGALPQAEFVLIYAVERLGKEIPAAGKQRFQPLPRRGGEGERLPREGGKGGKVSAEPRHDRLGARARGAHVVEHVGRVQHRLPLPEQKGVVAVAYLRFPRAAADQLPEGVRLALEREGARIGKVMQRVQLAHAEHALHARGPVCLRSAHGRGSSRFFFPLQYNT